MERKPRSVEPTPTAVGMEAVRRVPSSPMAATLVLP